jgi:hypothetical protein
VDGIAHRLIRALGDKPNARSESPFDLAVWP